MHAGRWLLAIAFVLPHLRVTANAQPGAKPATALENDYVLVSRNIAPCATATPDKCEDRVILAMGDLTLTAGARSAR